MMPIFEFERENVVQVPGPVVTSDRMVRVIRWQRDRGGINPARTPVGAVCFAEVDLGKERPFRRQILP